MAVKKKISRLDTFIDKGAPVKSVKDKNFKNILIRMPQEILEELDSYLLLNKPWANRTHYIIEAIYEKLNKRTDD